MKKLEQINVPLEEQTLQTFNELQSNKKELEKLHSKYLKKSEELRTILANYQKSRYNSGLNLRRIQLWFKLSYPKLSSSFKNEIVKFSKAKKLHKKNHPTSMLDGVE